MVKKKILFLITIIGLLFLIPTMAKSASNEVVSNKIVDGTDGIIEYELTNLDLPQGKTYVWGISKNNAHDGVATWYDLVDYNATSKSTSIILTPKTNEIKAILKTTDEAYLFIKEKDQDVEYIVDALKLDLTLPPLKAFRIVEDATWGKYTITSDDIANAGSNATYGIEKVSFQFEKITNNTLIENYKLALINNKDLSTLELATLSQAPKSGWENCAKEIYNPNYVPKASYPKDNGVYYLWLKAKDNDSKTIIGYTIVGIDTESPIVNSIRVDSPESGTYKTGKTVKVRVNFSEVITGTRVPTLKIRFGESEIRALNNGTIKKDYIEYTYEIKDNDVGQLATVSLEGGTIKDASGNNAILSCPVISGNTIKANVEDDGQGDPSNPTPTTPPSTQPTAQPSSSPSPSPTPGNGGSQGSGQTGGESGTNANGVPTRLPQTGETMIVVLVSLVVIIIGTIGYIKYRRLRDI